MTDVYVRLCRDDAERIAYAIAQDEPLIDLIRDTLGTALDAALAALAGDPAPEAAQFDQRVRAAMHAAGERTLREQFAAPAEGPERAATGETITDELVERCAMAIWKPGTWAALDPFEREQSRKDARHVLEAFGAASGGGGEANRRG